MWLSKSPRMVTAVVQRKADLGTKAFERGGQEVSLRQQESVIAASGGY